METLTMPIDHRQTKISLTFDEQIKEIDRTQFDMIEYGTEFIHLIHNENNKSLPTLKQLQLLECTLLRFYWTFNQRKTWSQILDIIGSVFAIDPKDDFRHVYCKQLIETNKDDLIEIERLLQLTL
jgi:negative regulator of sigma E activity